MNNTFAIYNFLLGQSKMFKKWNKLQSLIICMLIAGCCLSHLLNDSLWPTKINNRVQVSPVLTDNLYFPYFSVPKGAPWKTKKIPKTRSSSRHPRQCMSFHDLYGQACHIDYLSIHLLSTIVHLCTLLCPSYFWIGISTNIFVCIPKQKIHHLFVIGTVKNVVLPKT